MVLRGIIVRGWEKVKEECAHLKIERDKEPKVCRECIERELIKVGYGLKVSLRSYKNVVKVE